MQDVSNGNKPAGMSHAHVDKSIGFVFDDADPPEPIHAKVCPGSGCNGPGVRNDGKDCDEPLLSGVHRFWPTTYLGLDFKPACFAPPDNNPYANKKICELCFEKYKDFEKFTGKRSTNHTAHRCAHTAWGGR